ncbi:dihydroneopterin aldolase [Sphingomonas psychrotolerans]|uniref:dihydroneopterin aldolase n=1 Tax=Sphingomonas psychrotolerans TaxID=1327635 RepID=A0A2K8MHZ2_9SPHN|nr:dihydroneopterin aldolase [Sphingomonas psychrotolerans]ATY33500.1 dihydroneopterin aldolase [Sphingomonas psychrotolerans]
MAPITDRGGAHAELRITVRDLPVMADIGINPHEIGYRQPLIVSVTLGMDRVARDTIDATIDYRQVARAAEALGEQRIALIETFADRLAHACLALSGHAHWCEVTIDKPHALPAGIASITARYETADAAAGRTSAPGT